MMVWSFSAIVLLGLTHFATCASPNQSPEANREESKSFSGNNADFPSLLTTLSKRNDISRIDNGLLPFPPQSYPFRLAGRSLDEDEDSIPQVASSQNLIFPSGSGDSLSWFNPLFLYRDSNGLSQNEETDDSSRLASTSRTNESMDKPSNWKRRLQMQGPGLIGSNSGARGLIGYNNNRNKGLVLSIDLGIKALRDAIYHAKVRQQNRKLHAQAQRNMKLLHNIGKRRAELTE